MFRVYSYVTHVTAVPARSSLEESSTQQHTLHGIRVWSTLAGGRAGCPRFSRSVNFSFFWFFRDRLRTPKRISFRRAENPVIRSRSAIQKRDCGTFFFREARKYVRGQTERPIPLFGTLCNLSWNYACRICKFGHAHNYRTARETLTVTRDWTDGGDGAIISTNTRSDGATAMDCGGWGRRRRSTTRNVRRVSRPPHYRTVNRDSGYLSQ